MIKISIADKKDIVNSKGNIVNKKLFTFISVSLLVAVMLCFCSCSFVMDKIDSKLDDMGLSKEGNKVKEAWNSIGKEAVDGTIDDVMCGLEFRTPVEWPSNGIGASIPRPYYEKLASVSSTDDKGVITIDSFTKYEYRKYIELLNGEGYEKYTDAVPVVYVNVGTKIAVCPLYDEKSEKLQVLYADGFAGVTLLIKDTVSLS